MNFSTTNPEAHHAPEEVAKGVFDDPVAYLGSLGVTAVLVSDTTTLPAAA